MPLAGPLLATAGGHGELEGGSQSIDARQC